jgi:uncharacterized membrane protein YphA (DoxX/SURF4 family)
LVAWAMTLAAQIARFAVAAVLISAGVSKLWDRRNFSEVVQRFEILPRAAAGVFASSLPVTEIVAASCLLASMLVQVSVFAWSGLLAMALFAIFAVAVSVNLVRGRTNISCGCFGKRKQSLSWGLALRALCYLVMSAMTLPSIFGRFVVTERLGERINGALTAVGIVAAAWLSHFIFTTGQRQFDSG